MNRLQRELQRLYALVADAGLDAGDEAPRLIDAQGRVRAMVLELARPADWAALSAVWGGVQADLALPAPAIAVNGHDGLQLWFALLAPLPASQAWAFLEALRRRYLGAIKPARVRLFPALAPATASPALHARPVPAEQPARAVWSAYVASDLVPMFADEPWLDMPPNPEGQAQLLAPLLAMTPEAFEGAMQQLSPERVVPAPAMPPKAEAQAPGALDPRRFLLDVMNNDRLDMALRIEAAKALLPGFDAARR